MFLLYWRAEAHGQEFPSYGENWADNLLDQPRPVG